MSLSVQSYFLSIYSLDKSQLKTPFDFFPSINTDNRALAKFKDGQRVQYPERHSVRNVTIVKSFVHKAKKYCVVEYPDGSLKLVFENKLREPPTGKINFFTSPLKKKKTFL